MSRSKVLIVDDDDIVRRCTARMLSAAGYSVVEVSSTAEATATLASAADVAVLLCDIRMPGDSGLDLLRIVGDDYRDVAVVMVTGVDDPAVADAAFDLGASGYLVKPFTSNELVICVSSALRRRDLELARREYVRDVGRVVHGMRSISELVDDLVVAVPHNGDVEEMIERLSLAITARNDETGRHLERMSRYSAVLAEATGVSRLSSDEVRLATALHDIGKIGVADSILLKPGTLTIDEYSAMQQHARIGYQLLAGSPTRLMEAAASIAVAHHEWWDGGGYPRGLRGDEIPEEARLAAITDVFDALTSDRVYRPAVDFDEAVNIMLALRGRQFEPRLLDAFVEVLGDIRLLKAQFKDPTTDEGIIRVFLVDDHEIFVESLVRLLSTRPSVRVIGTAATVEQATKAVVAYAPDVVLMDFELPDGDGASATATIKALMPTTQVVMLTARADETAFVRAIEAGCAGFVKKHETVEHLYEAIEAVHSGDLTPAVQEMLPLLGRLEPMRRRVGQELRPREREVLQLAADGLSNKDIARLLSLSLNTVRNHMQNVLYRLDCHSKLEAVAAGVREGIVAYRR